MKRLILWIVAAGFCIGEPASAEDGGVYRYGPAVTTLTGEIELDPQFGPPGYGESPESDERIRVFVILLDRPISVTEESEDDFGEMSYDGLSKLQLAFHAETDVRSCVGKRATATGKLYGSDNARHYTNVLLWVDSIDCEK